MDMSYFWLFPKIKFTFKGDLLPLEILKRTEGNAKKGAPKILSKVATFAQIHCPLPLGTRQQSFECIS